MALPSLCPLLLLAAACVDSRLSQSLTFILGSRSGCAPPLAEPTAESDLVLVTW